MSEAEGYLKSKAWIHEHYFKNKKYKGSVVYLKDALEAVSLARKEERKNQFANVLAESGKELFRVKKIMARVREECEAKRLPINWRSNKEVIELVKSQKQEIAKKIQKIVVSYEGNIMKHHVKENTAQAFQVGAKTILQDVRKQIKNRFLSKPQSGKGGKN